MNIEELHFEVLHENISDECFVKLSEIVHHSVKLKTRLRRLVFHNSENFSDIKVKAVA
jgi:hypothetical protein